MKIIEQRVAIVNGRQFVCTIGSKYDDSGFVAGIDFGRIQSYGEGLSIKDAISDLDFKCRDLDKQYGGRIP